MFDIIKFYLLHPKIDVFSAKFLSEIDCQHNIALRFVMNICKESQEELVNKA